MCISVIFFQGPFGGETLGWPELPNTACLVRWTVIDGVLMQDLGCSAVPEISQGEYSAQP